MYSNTEFKYRIEDLEISIMSCLLLKPELMKKLDIEDKYFVKYRQYWQFMKAFYKRFGNFDVNLMYAIAKNKYQMFEFITALVEVEPTAENFYQYKNELVKLHNERKKEKYIIENVYELANDLYVRNISTNSFKEKVEEIYKKSDELFKGE